MFRALPIPLTQAYLRKLESLLTNFIWGYKNPRFNASVLTLPTSTKEQ